MKILMILMAVMTWTVESKNSVSGEGTWPYDIEVGYSNTYNKGQVRAGDEAVLQISNLGGICLESIYVYVKSNTSSGAGVFTISANDRSPITMAGTFADWTGSYDAANYHPIEVFNGQWSDVQELSIALSGVQNSLHIEKYVIYYASAEPHTVTLRNGKDVYSSPTETSGGGGILLPSMPDMAEWQFIGWSEQEIWEQASLPSVYRAETRYYPMADCTLWATYRYHLPADTGYMTEIASGEYLYVNRDADIALADVPDGGKMMYAKVNTQDPNQYYHIDFTAPDTAYITHAFSLCPIGYSGTRMAPVASPWLVYHEGEETLFYIESNNKTYVLWLNILDAQENYYAGLMPAQIGTSPMRLMYYDEKETDPLYSCHPENPKGVEEVSAAARYGEQTIMQFGNYELRITNGQKIIQSR